MNNIKSSVKQFHMQLGTKETGRTRARRGMFDSVGETAKNLFGVMDHDDDANYYSDKIK
jgi:translation elongation factor EF-1beta